MKRLHAFIEGRVQGVGFRQWTCQTARKLGLSGWVRNLPDGRVEAVAEGEEASVGALQNLLSQGPPAAQVTTVTAHTVELTKSEFVGFELRR